LQIDIEVDGTVMTTEVHGATFDAAGKGSLFRVGHENKGVALIVRDVMMKNMFWIVLCYLLQLHSPPIALPAGLQKRKSKEGGVNTEQLVCIVHGLWWCGVECVLRLHWCCGCSPLM
jgi:hypothetical protein